MAEHDTWTAAELDRIGNADELGIASLRGDGTLRGYVTIWVVRTGDGLFVRSAHGQDNPWFRRALRSGAGRISADGLERDVTFVTADAHVQEAIDAAYHAKYDQYGAAVVDPVVGPHTYNVTLQLLPR
jgi:hypothetical protein